MYREDKKVCQRENIMRAALHVFARHGYERAKLDQVARRAKVGKGTIYNYFKSKDELFEKVQEESLDLLFAVLAAPSLPGMSPVQ